MAIEVMKREFRFGDIILADPDPTLPTEEVLAMYSLQYPELTTAVIDDKEEVEDDDDDDDENETSDGSTARVVGTKTVYNIKKTAGTKG